MQSEATSSRPESSEVTENEDVAEMTSDFWRPNGLKAAGHESRASVSF